VNGLAGLANGGEKTGEIHPVNNLRSYSRVLLIALCLSILAGLLTFSTTTASAASPPKSEEDLLGDVMPGADYFSHKRGEPPVYQAFLTDPDSGEVHLMGYVFRSSDVPPNVKGYAGTIDVLVGLDLTGTITGVRVLRYSEPMKGIIGDFLRWTGVQEQFAGKSLTDNFRVGTDIDGISRATITVSAMARDIKNTSRRVAKAYLTPTEVQPTQIPASTMTPASEASFPLTVLGNTEPTIRADVEVADDLSELLAALPTLDDSINDIEDETVLTRLREQAADISVWILIGLLLLATYAFLKKCVRVRWLVLATTIVFLGFFDGSFLSVSHVTGVITVGTSLFTSDLKLLIITSFVIISTLFWGRVFCGYICPFGAIQTFLARFVPSRFQRELPKSIHERAQYIKYGLLLVPLILAVTAENASTFHYLEPFGTIFFLTPSFWLWAILVGVLIGSAVVPQFYCRYACPLGATLGLLSVLSIFRIRRVAQCGVCNLCEQKCPTGAIRGAEIQFRECVRCGICESQLNSLKGSCRHDLEQIRTRLKNWPTAGSAPTIESRS